MQETNLFLVFLKPLNDLRLTYMVTGSVASTLYGEPRLTHDVDIVIELKREQAGPMAKAFPDSEFYCPPPEIIAVEASRISRGHFNLIHHASGFKADVYLRGQDPLHTWGLSGKRKLEVAGQTVWLAPPEYVIVRKLEYYREGGSDKHLRDIWNMLELLGEKLDRSLIEAKAFEAGLSREWAAAQSPRGRERKE